MAEGTIKLTPELIDASLAELVQGYDSMVDACGTFGENGSAITEAWEGAAGESCKELLELLNSRMISVTNGLGQFDENLNYANLSYVQTDELCAKKESEVGSGCTTRR